MSQTDALVIEESDLAEFTARFNDLCANEHLDEALDWLYKETHQKMIGVQGMDLISIVFSHLCSCEDLQTSNRAKYELLVDMLRFTCKLSKPKEILLALMEVLETLEHQDSVLELLMVELRLCLLQLPSYRGNHSFHTILQLVYKYVHNLPLVVDHEFTELDVVHAENCTQSMRSVFCMRVVLDWCQVFVNEVTAASHIYAEPDTRHKQNGLLIDFLLDLIIDRLIYIEFDSSRPALNRDALHLSERMFTNVLMLRPEIMLNIKLYSTQHQSAIALLYWMYMRGVTSQIESINNLIPSIYSNQYRFDNILMPLLSAAMKQTSKSTHTVLQRRVLRLLQYAIELLDVDCALLNTDWLTQQSVQDLLQSYMSLLYSIQTPDLTNQCARLLYSLLDRFTVGTRPKVTICLLELPAPNTQQQNVLHAYLIDYVRKSIIAHQSIDNLLGQSAFSESIRHVINLGTRLPDGEVSDILDGLQRHSAILLLMRFLTLRFTTDQLEALSLTLDYRRSIDKHYRQKLIRAVDLSRAHYKLELTNQQTEQLELSNQQSEEETSVMREHKTDWLQRALHNMDLLSLHLADAAVFCVQQSKLNMN